MPDPSTEPFLWGTATASHQIEGAAAEGGRAPSIWDVFAHTPGKVERGETGDVACDHYHCYKEDVALMRDLGIQAYRFSISWSRVLPEGQGRPNTAGFDFYDRLVDELVTAGLTPFATLFHWDLPQALQDRGGFANRDVAGWFSDYAAETAERLGDRVKDWIILNEPSVYARLGHALGVHAPGLADLQAFRAVTHHLNLAQGAALQALRSTDPASRLGTTLNVQRGVPADGSEASAAMAQRHNGDLEMIRQPIDFLGVNHYSRAYIQADPKALSGFRRVSPPPETPRTSFDWEINRTSFATCCFGSTTLIPALRFTLQKTAPTSTTPCPKTARFTTPGESNSLTSTSGRCGKPSPKASMSAAISSGRFHALKLP